MPVARKIATILSASEGEFPSGFWKPNKQNKNNHTKKKTICQ